MRLVKRGHLTIILLFPILLCCNTPERQNYELNATELLKLAKLSVKDKTSYLTSRGWKEIADLSFEYADKEERYLITEIPQEGANVTCDMVLTSNEELYVQYKKDFESLGYKFELSERDGLLQFMAQELEGSHLVGVLLQQTDTTYQIGVFRQRITLKRKSNKNYLIPERKYEEPEMSERTEEPYVEEEYTDEEIYGD